MFEDAHGTFEATCDTCQARESVETASRELAVLRLIRAGWHLTTEGAALCSGCCQRPTLRRRRFEV